MTRPAPTPIRLTVTPAEMVAAFKNEAGVLVNDFVVRALAVRDSFKPRSQHPDEPIPQEVLWPTTKRKK